MNPPTQDPAQIPQIESSIALEEGIIRFIQVHTSTMITHLVEANMTAVSDPTSYFLPANPLIALSPPLL